MWSFKNILRLLGKWYVIILLLFFVQLTFESCSRHYRQKRMIKRRKTSTIKRHQSTYQRKVKRRTLPINKNYLIKHKQPKRSTYRR